MSVWLRGTVFLCALGASGLFGACGDQGGTALTPVGEAIHIGRGLVAGDGVRMTMESKATSRIVMGETDVEQDVTMSMTMMQRCEQRTEDGGSILSMAIESFKMEGLPAGAEAPDLEGFMNMKGTMTVGPDGQVAGMVFEGLDPSLEAIVKPMLQNGGFNATFPSGPDGLRVGDTIPIEDVMPVEQFNAGLAAGMPGSTGAVPGMKFEGGYTLVGVRMIDGVEAAEFAVDVTTTLSMDMGAQGSMETRSQSKGAQFVNIATGMPVGESTLHGTTSSTMNMVAAGEAQAMTTTGTTKVTMRAERLK